MPPFARASRPRDRQPAAPRRRGSRPSGHPDPGRPWTPNGILSAATAVAIGLGLLVATTPAGPVGDEIQVNQRTLGNQQTPDVAALPDGRFLVVWESPDSPGDDPDSAIVGRYVDDSGTGAAGGSAAPVGDELQVNLDTTYRQRGPRIDSRPDGSFVISWRTGYPGGKGTLDALAARPFSSAGVGGAAEFQLATAPNIYTLVTSHDLGAAAHGGFVVAFGDFYDNGTGDYRGSATLRRFDAAGALLEQTSLGAGDDQQFATRIAGNGSEFALAWLEWEPFGQYGTVRGRRLDAAGSPLGATIEPQSEDGSPNQAFAGGNSTDVGLAPSGRWVVAWDGYDPQGSATSAEIYGRSIDAAGSPDPAGVRAINLDTAGSQGRPRVASTPDGTFLVVWENRDAPDDEGTGLRGRWLASDGTPFGEEMAINRFTQGDQVAPEVAASTDGKSFLVVWQSTAGDGSDQDGTSIRARRIVVPDLFADGFESGGLGAWSSSSR